jgi:prepilin-type N-terminal cleavage/methylation domain-containing protein
MRIGRNKKLSKAFTLTEIMVAMVIICVAAVGVLDYQYNSLKQSRFAQVQLTASRTAQLLIEDWKSQGGSSTYDPTKLNMGFVSSTGTTEFLGGQSVSGILNNAIYSITINKVPLKIVLVYSDVAEDEISQTTLRQLTAIIKWRTGEAMGGGGQSLCTTPVTLSTYVRLDG